MPSYKTLAQVLIATSAVGSALAAPALAQEMHDARTDLSQLDRRRLDPEVMTILKTAPIAGVVSGTVAALMAYGQKYVNHAIPQSVPYPFRILSCQRQHNDFFLDLELSNALSCRIAFLPI